jgi:hypothetical protein
MKNHLGPTFATNIYLKDIMSTSASSTNIGNLKHLSVRLPQTLPRYPHHLASRHPVQGMNLRILVTHIRPLTTHNKGSSETIASVLQKRGMIAGVLNSLVCISKILRRSLGVLVSPHPIPFLLSRPRQLIQPLRHPRVLRRHIRVLASIDPITFLQYVIPRHLVQAVRLPRILHQHLRVPTSLHVIHPLSHG